MCEEILSRCMQREAASAAAKTIKVAIQRGKHDKVLNLVDELPLGSRDRVKLLYCINTYKRSC